MERRPDHRPLRGGRFHTSGFGGQRRAQNHDLAEAEALRQLEATIPFDPRICRDTPSLINTPSGLSQLIDQIKLAGSFGFDTEFIGETSYHPKLCVVQIATPKRVAVIDAMARLDLKSLWALIADPAIEKIVHAGYQDLEPVVRLIQKAPVNVFDTQIAAALAGFVYPVGLARLVHDLVGVDLGKQLKFSQWDRRPLSVMQVRYAANDVRFLPALRGAIGRKLESVGNDKAAAEECLTLTDPKLYTFDPNVQITRVRSAGMLRPRELAVLRELVAWRDATARRHDIPPRTLVPDAVIVAMSRSPITSEDELKAIAGLPRPIEQRYGLILQDAARRGQAVPEGQLPPPLRIKENPAERTVIDAAWTAVQEACKARSIDPMIFSTRGEVADVVRHLAAGTDPGASRLLRGWRKAIAEPLLRQAAAPPAA